MIEASSDSKDPGKPEKKVVKKHSLLSVLKTANNVLIFVAVVATLLLVNEVKSGAELLGKSVQFEVDQGIVKRSLSRPVRKPKVSGVTFYLAKIDRRNLFQPYEARGLEGCCGCYGEESSVNSENWKIFD